MVGLQRRFTLLAALTTIAAVSVIPSTVECAVVPADYKEAEASAGAPEVHHSTRSHSLTHTEAADPTQSTSSDHVKSGKSQRQQQPVLPLPIGHSGEGKKSKDVVSDVGTHHKDKRDAWDEPDYTRRPELAWLASHDDAVKHDMDIMHIPGKRHDHDDHDRHHDKVTVNGDHDDVHMHSRMVNSRLRARDPNDIAHIEGGAGPHILPDGLVRRSPHDRHHNKVVVDGNDDDDDRGHEHPSVHVRRSPRHHDHDRHRHDKVVVDGSNDNVHVSRSPHDHHDHDRKKVIVKGDNDNVDVHHRRADVGPSVHVSDNNGSPSVTVTAFVQRDGQQTVGVPGSIDIMSEDPSSENAVKIASLVLSAPSNGTSREDNATMSTFVLNASGADHTQMYLVAIPDAGNSTSSGNAASSGNSTSSGPAPLMVALQVPVFNAANATMDNWCATFDPMPSKPSPMYVQECMANVTAGGEHMSQVFAYEPASGVIRPMWSLDGSDSDSDSSVYGSDSSNPTSTTVASEASSTTTANPTSSTAPTETNLAQDIVNLEADRTEATTPPSRAASSAKIFDTNSAAQPRNVTLVFTPAAPMFVAPVAGPVKAVVPASTGDDDGGDGTADDDGDDGGDQDSGDGSDDDGSDGGSDDEDSGDDSGLDASASIGFGSSSALSSTVSATATSSGTSSTATTDASSSSATSSTSVFSEPAARVVSTSSAAPSSTATSSSSDTGSTSTPTDSIATDSATTTTQDPSLAVEVYDPSATESPSASTTDSSTATASATDSSDSTGSTLSASIVARYRILEDYSSIVVSNSTSSTMGTDSTSTTSTVSAEMTGFAGRLREGTAIPGNKGWVQV
ncbi:uncharacterized protein C8Q71DRAFT_458244 [Rhodofomes roseus]|uniref:Uncharacterized protein n=1 Tax=Rhodofomes roseus TaxID=34475 RepID=A0ABQ8KN01_9APHY|nr:uncharacterized protein C8Q71DRAFT_458244 [Rhodofomes roseus]KAH9839686.1 hypothetical protein C8Q71DRAFT_458244 [Rhodofomes roseus]